MAAPAAAAVTTCTTKSAVARTSHAQSRIVSAAARPITAHQATRPAVPGPCQYPVAVLMSMAPPSAVFSLNRTTHRAMVATIAIDLICCSSPPAPASVSNATWSPWRRDR